MEVLIYKDGEEKWVKVIKQFISTPNGYETPCYTLEDGTHIVQAQVLNTRNSP